MYTAIDGNKEALHEGDRVYSYECDGSKVYGTLWSNIDYPKVSKWYIEYDDNEACAVLDMSIVFKSDE